MTTIATQIRDAIFTRVSTLTGYTKFQREPVPNIAPADVPVVTVFILSENLTPDGDPNAGAPKFEAIATIAVSVLRGFSDPVTLDGQIDVDLDAIENLLLSDPTFVGWGPHVPVPFESVMGIRRQRIYHKDAEAYFIEARLEFQFLNRVYYPPNITTGLTEITVANPAAPTVLDLDITLPYP